MFGTHNIIAVRHSPLLLLYTLADIDAIQYNYCVVNHRIDAPIMTLLIAPYCCVGSILLVVSAFVFISYVSTVITKVIAHRLVLIYSLWTRYPLCMMCVCTDVCAHSILVCTFTTFFAVYLSHNYKLLKMMGSKLCIWVNSQLVASYWHNPVQCFNSGEYQGTMCGYAKSLPPVINQS